MVHDKVSNVKTIMELEITCTARLKETEIAKARKYRPLAGELQSIYGFKINMIPCLMMWDGVVTKHYRIHLKEIGVKRNIEAYMHTIVLRKTLESS